MRKGYFSALVYCIVFFFFISFNANPVFSEEVSLEKFLLLVQVNNKILKASSFRLESTYYSVRSAVAPQRPSLGIQGATNSVTSETAENTISAGVNQRIGWPSSSHSTTNDRGSYSHGTS